MLSESADSIRRSMREGQEVGTLASTGIELVPASKFSIEELTEFYNHSRIDYIVPMPMNATRLQEYISNYDVVLESSAVAMRDNDPLGLAMIGVRPHHTWVTRLGVFPKKRRCGAGRSLMEHLVNTSYSFNADYMVLEVIKNNDPAYFLFKKLGFEETREILVLRRPPGPPQHAVPPYSEQLLGSEDAIALLSQRRSIPSWLDETPSLINAGNLMGLRVESADGSCGWLVYQSTVFQLSRLVLQTEAGDPAQVARTLLHALHSHHPAQDTKTENLPWNDPHLPGMLDANYIVAFRRIEMRLDLG